MATSNVVVPLKPQPVQVNALASVTTGKIWPYTTTSRTDTATITSGSATVSDAAITTADAGRPVSGTGIPTGTYVGTVTAGTSFTLVTASGAAANATAAGTSVTIGGSVAPTLPALSGVADDDYLIVEKDSLDTSSNAVTVTCASSDATANGSTTIPLTVKGERVELQAATIGGTRVWKVKHHTIPKAGLDGVYALAAEIVNTVATSGSAVTLPSPATAGISVVTLTANCAVTLPTPVAGRSFLLQLVQDSTGGRAVTWTGAVKWPGGAAPALSGGSGKTDLLQFTAVSNSAWFGFFVGADIR